MKTNDLAIFVAEMYFGMKQETWFVWLRTIAISSFKSTLEQSQPQSKPSKVSVKTVSKKHSM